MDISSQSIIARYAHPIALRNNGNYTTLAILKLGEDVRDKVYPMPTDSTLYVVVIGEAHNKHHTDLYGYRLSTNPKMKAHADSGEMIAFNHCTALYDATHKAMYSIYSLGHGIKDVENYPIFPQIFKAAGYKVFLYDNQFLGESGHLHFISSKEIFNQCCDYHNSKLYKYDGDMIEQINFECPSSLIIINMQGQHYNYSDRLPPDFKPIFTTNDYSDYPHAQRQTLCDYDNTLIYTDSLLDRIISSIEDKDACLIYFSDHGEEIFDYGDFIGHGNANTRDNPTLQLSVPFYVWGSIKFRSKDVWNDIKKAQNLNICTDDFPHFIIDLANISCPDLSPTRSFINNQYNHD